MSATFLKSKSSNMFTLIACISFFFHSKRCLFPATSGILLLGFRVFLSDSTVVTTSSGTESSQITVSLPIVLGLTHGVSIGSASPGRVAVGSSLCVKVLEETVFVTLGSVFVVSIGFGSAFCRANLFVFGPAHTGWYVRVFGKLALFEVLTSSGSILVGFGNWCPEVHFENCSGDPCSFLLAESTADGTANVESF